ncbi:DUF72 domain-containing protein [Paenibacillus endoradicis]|uniref:DUF72 domain-containing protein n=1 Tax=Paenibacillus endoradicis TaxID=2972487 RepID=UPI00215904C7|nr:DUF72 domain-containing protein [Paenibacillus endoradicis]MCR8659618.1 DUF72 domain-containing protein [Paenibacillus endoradicis]
MSIYIGLGGWGDHDSLYSKGTKSTDRLSVYTKHFEIVEIDSTFYAIQSPERMRQWMAQTPPHFKFIVKAYQGMTGHQRGSSDVASKREEMFAAFLAMIQPLIEHDRLICVLFQYPPWFDCMTKHVMVLRATKKLMNNIPCALEFRHQSWFRDEMRAKTIQFMKDEQWIHSVCDEPQAGDGSIPMIIESTNETLTMVRLHGRNESGWNDTGDDKWREVRYLYDYSEQQLAEWLPRLEQLSQGSEDVFVIFNNNSGGHAAHNAKQLMILLGQQRPDGKHPMEALPQSVEQLELF